MEGENGQENKYVGDACGLWRGVASMEMVTAWERVFRKIKQKDHLSR